MRPALAFLVVAFAAVPAAALAADPRVDAFRSLCADYPEDNSGTVSAALAAGWQPVASAENPALTTLLKAIADPADRAEATASLQKNLATGAAFLVVTKLTAADGGVFASCGVYDFTAKAPVGQDDIAAWIGTPGQAMAEDAESGTSIYWDGPKKLAEPWTISVRFNPPGGLMNDMDGFTGAAIGSWIMPADSGAAGDDGDNK